jgi:hypothetical protein
MEGHCRTCGQAIGPCDLTLQVEDGFVCIQCEHAANLAGPWLPRIWFGIGAAVLIVAGLIVAF